MPDWSGFFQLNPPPAKRERSPMPQYAFQLGESCTRAVVSRMLRGRGYRLDFTRFKKDKGAVKVYMFDSWADPMMFKIGEYQEGDEPDWSAIYDAAMERHLETKENGLDMASPTKTIQFGVDEALQISATTVPVGRDWIGSNPPFSRLRCPLLSWAPFPVKDGHRAINWSSAAASGFSIADLAPKILISSAESSAGVGALLHVVDSRAT